MLSLFLRGAHMALREYRWRGFTWQIADEDVHMYPGAVPVEPMPKEKNNAQVKNKSRRAPKNK